MRKGAVLENPLKPLIYGPSAIMMQRAFPCAVVYFERRICSVLTRESVRNAEFSNIIQFLKPCGISIEPR